MCVLTVLATVILTGVIVVLLTGLILALSLDRARKAIDAMKYNPEFL